jgi:PKD repeat protein
VTRTAQVDIVAPVMTVTTAVTGVLQAVSSTLLAGTLSDGMEVASLAVRVAGPGGSVRWTDLGFAGGVWSYSDRFDLPGQYRMGLEVEDVAGNHRSVGPFLLTVYQSDQVADLSLAHDVSSDPMITDGPITYTYEIHNAGPGVATTSTLAIRPPAVASLLSAPLGCGQTGLDLVCDLGDIAVGVTTWLDVRFYVPLTATGYLLGVAGIDSGKVDLDPANNSPVPLYTRVVQPITGLTATSDGPTVLGQVTTLTAAMSSGTGVSFDWSPGDGESATSIGTYETGAKSAVTHIYPDVGVYTVVVTASNEVNSVSATTVVTTDIAVATPLLDEGFEGEFPPPGWLGTSVIAGETENWRPTTRQAFAGHRSALFDDYFGQQDAWLVTPQFTPTLGSELVFWQYQNYGFLYGRHSILASTGSCDPKDGDFVELAELGPGAEDTWEEVRLNLDQFAGLPICLAFRYEGDWDDEWYIDNVQVTVELVLTHDGPTILGQLTTMTASVATGTNVSFDWDLGGGQVGSGGIVSYTFPSAGYHTVAVTASNSVGAISAAMVVPVRAYVHLPLVLRGYAPTCLDVYEPDGSPAQASVIAVDGTPQRHTFHTAGDSDWIAFDVPDAGVDYIIETFDLIGADTVVYLYDSDGVSLLDWNDDTGPTSLASYLYFNPYHAGTFYIQIVDYDPDAAGCDVAYSVRVTAQP